MQNRPTFTCLTMDFKDKEPDYWPLIRSQIDCGTLMNELVTMYKKQPILREDQKPKEKDQDPSGKENKRQQYSRKY